MRQMQSITLIRSLTIGDKTPRMNQGLADQNKSGPEHIDLLIINKFSNLNIIVAAALDFLVFDWQLIVNHGSFPLLLSWLVSYYYCLTHWLRICCDKQLSKMPRPGLRLLFVNLWGTGPLFDSLACVFDTVCIIIQDLKSVWFICRQLNFDSKCQVSCRYYIELNSEALQARPLHHCRSVTAVKLLS